MPRAIVSWRLAGDPLRWYLHDGALRWYGGGEAVREVDLVGKRIVAERPANLPRAFHPAGVVRMNRLTIARYVSSRPVLLWMHELDALQTGYATDTIVLDGPPASRLARRARPHGALARARRAPRAEARMSDGQNTLAVRLAGAARSRDSWLQLLKFGVVGGSGYLINLGVFAFLSGNLGVYHAVAAIGAFCVAVTSNFLWNRYWTFGPGEGLAHLQAARFLAVSVACAGDQPGRARAAGRARRDGRTRRPGDRRRRRDAVQLPRQQALDLHLSARAVRGAWLLS